MAQTTFNRLPADVRAASVAALNGLLATATDLSVQAKHAHWNVAGVAFVAVHEMFDRVADEARGWADDIAERISALGGVARGTLQAAVKGTILREMAVSTMPQAAACIAISAALAAFSAQCLSASRLMEDKDCSTENRLQEISFEADKLMFLVERHLA